MNAGHGKRSIMHFNPRSHEGSDQTALIIARERWIFQSTLPRGERRLQIWVMKCSLRFQSTLPRGERRLSLEHSVPHITISIHAPTRGATIDVLLNSASAQFQSTLPRGERHITGATTCSRLNFNPRSHEGSDNGDFLSFPQSKDFNPRSHEGSDSHIFPQKRE